MLTIYLLSIVLWMMIILGTAIMLLEPIKNNGWLCGIEYDFVEGMFAVFVISSIPVLRLIAVICYFIMARMTEKEFYDWIENHK